MNLVKPRAVFTACSAVALACSDATPAAIAPVDSARVTQPAALAPFDGAHQPEVVARLVATGAGQLEAVQVIVTLRNADSIPRTLLRTTACLINLRLYGDSARAMSPLFQEEFQTGGCKGVLRMDTLAAGASKAYTNTPRPLSSLHNPLSPSLVAGRYYASVSIGMVELLPVNALRSLGEVVLP